MSFTRPREYTVSIWKLPNSASDTGPAARAISRASCRKLSLRAAAELPMAPSAASRIRSPVCSAGDTPLRLTMEPRTLMRASPGTTNEPRCASPSDAR